MMNFWSQKNHVTLFIFIFSSKYYADQNIEVLSLLIIAIVSNLSFAPSWDE